jgi:ATP-binding cassette subfamily C protein
MSPFRQALHLLDPAARRRLPLLLASLSIGLIFPLMLAVVDPSAVTNAPGLRWIRTTFGDVGHAQLVLGFAVVTSMLFVAKNVMAALLTRWQYRVMFDAEAEIGVRLFLRYLTTPWRAIAGRNSSELIRNASTCVSHVVLSVLIPGMTLVVELMLACAIVAMLLLVDPLAALVCFGLALVAGSSYYLMVHGMLARIGHEFQESTFGLLNQLKQGIGAGREIRVLGRTDELIRHMRDVRAVYARSQARRNFLNQLPRNYLETTLVLAVLITIVVLTVTRGTEPLAPVLAVFAVAALRLLASAGRILASLQQVRIGLAPLRSVHDDFQLLPPPSEPVARGVAPREPARLRSGIVLTNLSFRYEPDRPALADINLTIPWGDNLGVIGASGSGKSTLIDVILGLLPPQQGRIEIDGRPLAEVAGWQQCVGYVPQVIYLTDDTLRRNVAFGLADHEIDESTLRRALDQANLLDVVAGLPKGVDTPVGELGASLSGGQRQRIGVARALYHDPEVLILDEATSALDSETESNVLGAIEALSGKKTVIVVAHRLSTLSRCSRLIVLKEGRIVDCGRFDELNQRNAEFARMVTLSRAESIDVPELAP